VARQRTSGLSVTQRIIGLIASWSVRSMLFF
jgi:hypothetical protein